MWSMGWVSDGLTIFFDLLRPERRHLGVGARPLNTQVSGLPEALNTIGFVCSLADSARKRRRAITLAIPNPTAFDTCDRTSFMQPAETVRVEALEAHWYPSSNNKEM